MTDTKSLKKKIKDSGLTMTAISRKVGITREALYNKMSGESEFKASEIAVISEALNLSSKERDYIFFAHTVN